MAALLGPAADVLLCETMSSIKQATLAHQAVQSQGASTVATEWPAVPLPVANTAFSAVVCCQVENLNAACSWLTCREVHMGGDDPQG